MPAHTFNESFTAAVNLREGESLPREYVLGLIRELDRQGQALASLHRLHSRTVSPVPATVTYSVSPADRSFALLIDLAIANGDAARAQELAHQRNAVAHGVY